MVAFAYYVPGVSVYGWDGGSGVGVEVGVVAEEDDEQGEVREKSASGWIGY